MKDKAQVILQAEMAHMTLDERLAHRAKGAEELRAKQKVLQEQHKAS